MTLNYLKRMMHAFLEREYPTMIEVGTESGTSPLVTIEKLGQKIVLEDFMEWLEEETIQTNLTNQLRETPTEKRSIN